MSGGGSITHWVRAMPLGDQDAAQRLWERYFRCLLEVARQRLRDLPRPGGADEEDVVLSAFDSFYTSARAGRFPQLADRNDLWRLLVVMTAHKARDLVRRERAQKRFAGKPAAEVDLEQVLGDEPTPEFAAQVAEEYRRLLNRLDEPELRTVAVWKLEGYSNEEIAAKLGCVTRTVERKLWRIRTLWGEPGEAS